MILSLFVAFSKSTILLRFQNGPCCYFLEIGHFVVHPSKFYLPWTLASLVVGWLLAVNPAISVLRASTVQMFTPFRYLQVFKFWQSLFRPSTYYI